MHSRNDYNLGPKLSLRANGPWGLALRASYGEGFRTPTFLERYLVFDHSEQGFYILGDPYLRPVRSRGLRVAGLAQPIGRLQLEAEYYINLLQDLIDYAYVGDTDDGLQIFRSTNIARAYTSGLNLSANMRDIGRSVDVQVSDQYLLAAVDSSHCSEDNPYFCDNVTSLPLRPAHSAHGKITWHNDRIGTRLFAHVELMSERPQIEDDGQYIELSGHALVGLGWRQKISPKTEFSLLVDNLTDAYHPIYGPKPGRAVWLGFRAQHSRGEYFMHCQSLVLVQTLCKWTGLIIISAGFGLAGPVQAEEPSAQADDAKAQTQSLMPTEIGARINVPIIEHRIRARFNPARHQLHVIDTLRVPKDKDPGTVYFRLHAGLKPRCLDKGCDLRIANEDALSQGETKAAAADQKNKLSGATKQFIINDSGQVSVATQRYRMTLPSGADQVQVEYSGRIFHPLKQGEEYARSFAETPGTIEKQGLYLAGSSYWLPSFDDALLRFDMALNLPKDWDAVSQGERTAHQIKDGARLVRWVENTLRTRSISAPDP